MVGPEYGRTMQSVFPWLVIFAVVATFVVPAIGLLSMLKGGEFNAKYGNRLMRLRIGFQIAAVALIAL
jgi:hypothetical protein